jgi:hypothetical protein
MKPDGATLASIASITAAFGTAVLLFRVQRENDMRSMGERVWLPWSDWLILAATICSLVLVLVPVAAGYDLRLSSAASSSSSICVAGYIPSILAHYRIVFGGKRSGPRNNPEPLEFFFVVLTVVIAMGFGWRVMQVTMN